jgi:MOSC domain-containing protein YiiM
MTETRAETQGEVTGIYIATAEGEATQGQTEIGAVAGSGLEGDRYFGDAGNFGDGTRKSQITLIESEAIEALIRDYDIPFEPGESRRNVVTRGIALNHLVNRKFKVGGAVCEGVRLCEPCTYLEGLTRKGVRKGLIHRGGLRAQIVESGSIRVGDSIGVVAD